MEERLKEISEQINTQDNRITADPVFCVEREIIDHGYDSDYAEDYCWFNSNDPEELYYEWEEEFQELEEKHENGEIKNFWAKGYYKKRWEFVTCCFTEKGCEDYLKANGHNLGKTRIYANSAYRNREWIDLRKYLSGLTKQPKQRGG